MNRRYEMAVVAMQIACELLAQQALEAVVARARVSGKSVRRPVTLQDHPTRAILQLATGDRIQDEPWWPDYVAHVDRRKGVVHDGLAVPRAQAEESWTRLRPSAGTCAGLLRPTSDAPGG